MWCWSNLTYHQVQTNIFTNFSPDEFLSMMFDICKLEDGKACVSLFLDVSQFPNLLECPNELYSYLMNFEF